MTEVPAEKDKKYQTGKENRNVNGDPGAFSAVLKRLCRDRYACIALVITLLYLAAAVFAEGYKLYCDAKKTEPVYMVQDHANRYAPPSWKHPMGTDYLGRDVFLRGLFAIKTAVKVGVIASILSAFAGVILGLYAGYYGGRTDDAVVWIYSTFASMPSLLFILAFALLATKGFLWGPLEKAFQYCAVLLRTEVGMLAVYLGIGLTGWVSLCRVVRAETLRLRDMPYVQASRVLGQKDRRIIFKHILPNLIHLVIIYFTMRFAYAVMTEVIVSYLGLGAQFEPSWGIMISDGQDKLWRGIYWETAGATLFMFILVLSLNVLGDALRDALDPKMKI
ncbi:MAG: ABC transporter permease [Lentisphaeria bacterium]|nr:ABC transporter permease [Lentisphaeria bacterium]